MFPDVVHGIGISKGLQPKKGFKEANRLAGMNCLAFLT